MVPRYEAADHMASTLTSRLNRRFERMPWSLGGENKQSKVHYADFCINGRICPEHD